MNCLVSVFFLLVILFYSSIYRKLQDSSHSLPSITNRQSIFHRHQSVLSKPFLFFIPDYHDGTRYDLTSQLTFMNQSVILSSTKGGIKKWFPLRINQTQEYDPSSSSPQIIVPKENMWGPDEAIHVWNESILQRSYSSILNYKPFQQADCVVCMYLPSYCQYYVPFNKTTIFIPAHRFFLKKCNQQEYDHLFRIMFTDFPNVHVVASGLYDYEHIYYFSGKRVPIIYSTSLFGYNQPDSYHPIRDDYLGPFKKEEIPFEKELMAACKRNNIKTCNFTTMIKAFGKGWSYESLFQFKAAIIFPYATLSYFMNDLFASCIPIFVPSPAFLFELKVMRETLARSFCWYGTGDGRFYSEIITNYTKHPFNPEDESREARIYWNQFSTFYSPSVTVFNNWDDLFVKLQTTNLTEKYLLRKNENDAIKKNNIREWKRIFDLIERNREMPPSYEEALKRFGVKSFV